LLDVESRENLQTFALALRNKLLSLSQVSAVNRSGYLKEEITILKSLPLNKVKALIVSVIVFVSIILGLNNPVFEWSITNVDLPVSLLKLFMLLAFLIGLFPPAIIGIAKIPTPTTNVTPTLTQN